MNLKHPPPSPFTHHFLKAHKILKNKLLYLFRSFLVADEVLQVAGHSGLSKIKNHTGRKFYIFSQSPHNNKDSYGPLKYSTTNKCANI